MPRLSSEQEDEKQAPLPCATSGTGFGWGPMEGCKRTVRDSAETPAPTVVAGPSARDERTSEYGYSVDYSPFCAFPLVTSSCIIRVGGSLSGSRTKALQSSPLVVVDKTRAAPLFTVSPPGI